MIVISCAVRFWQEYRSSVAAIKLQSSITTEVGVRRQLNFSGSADLTLNEQGLVPGYLLLLDSGIAVPADRLILEATNLQISQSMWAILDH